MTHVKIRCEHPFSPLGLYGNQGPNDSTPFVQCWDTFRPTSLGSFGASGSVLRHRSLWKYTTAWSSRFENKMVVLWVQSAASLKVVQLAQNHFAEELVLLCISVAVVIL